MTHEEFGKRLQLLAQQAGLSQLPFANLIGTEQSAISRVMRGTQEPKRSTLSKMCVVLLDHGISSDQLVWMIAGFGERT